MSEIIAEQLGLTATKEVVSGLFELIQAGEIVLEDGKLTFADVTPILALLTSGTGGKIIGNFPQMLKELQELNSQEFGQVASYGHQIYTKISDIVKEAQQ